MDIKQLAENHWDWVQGFINTLDSFGFDEDTLKYIYETAFIHGFKHGAAKE